MTAKPKKHDSLHRVGWTQNWVFRRFSSEKGKEFVKSTGIPATDANAARAYKKGRDMYDTWLGGVLPSGRQLLVRDIARAMMRGKGQRGTATQRWFRNQIENHVIPHFGHLRPEQITSTRWEVYDAEERKRVYRRKRGGREQEYTRTRIWPTGRALKEIMVRAVEEKLAERVPKLKNFDPPAEPPRVIEPQVYRRIRRALPWPVKFLAFWMYWMGSRPSETLAYDTTMLIDQDDDGFALEVPAEITKTRRSRRIHVNPVVARALNAYLRRSATNVLFPSSRGSGRIKSWNGVWDRTMAALGLDFTIYNLRDTFITRKLREGISAVYIGKHTDTSALVIEKRYAVPTEEIMRRVAR
jgi:hypothetical protein